MNHFYLTKLASDAGSSLAGTPSWYEADKTQSITYLTSLIFAPKPLPKYTITTLPPASANEGVPLYVTNGAGNRYLVISNGTAWYYGDGTAV